MVYRTRKSRAMRFVLCSMTAMSHEGIKGFVADTFSDGRHTRSSLRRCSPSTPRTTCALATLVSTNPPDLSLLTVARCVSCWTASESAGEQPLRRGEVMALWPNGHERLDQQRCRDGCYAHTEHDEVDRLQGGR